MPVDARPDLTLCHCLAVRQAARHVTRFYDQFLAPSGLRTTQFSILAKLRRAGSETITTLARDLVMDRTTLGRNLRPLEREGLIAIGKGSVDQRSREVRLTEAGAARLRAGIARWIEAQGGFETVFGNRRSSSLRALLSAVSAVDFGAASADMS